MSVCVTRCAASCVDSFLRFENLAATTAGQTPPVPGVRNIDECKARCLDDDRCNGFNWMRDGRNDTEKCLIYNRLIGDTTEVTLFDLYVRERCRPQIFITFGPGTPGACTTRWGYSPFRRIPFRRIPIRRKPVSFSYFPKKEMPMTSD